MIDAITQAIGTSAYMTHRVSEIKRLDKFLEAYFPREVDIEPINPEPEVTTKDIPKIIKRVAFAFAGFKPIQA